MQLRNWSAFVLYVGSYLPLSLILVAQDIDFRIIHNGLCTPRGVRTSACILPLGHPAWALGSVAVSFACLVGTLWVLGKVQGQHRVHVTEAKHIPADLINYVIPYVLSFMGLDFATPSKLLGFAVFFVWVFWITYRSGQIIMNPMLIAFGWRLYEVKFNYLQSQELFTGRALSKLVVEPNGNYRQATLQDIMIIREQGRDG